MALPGVSTETTFNFLQGLGFTVGRSHIRNGSHGSSDVDLKLFKQAVGAFPSGVTVITVRTAKGEDHGMTASAFTSLSLEPPLILVCVQKKNTSYDLLRDAGAFAVNILAANQEEQSNRFADRLCDRNGEWQVWPEDRDKFADLQFRRGLQSGGAALIHGSVAHLECRLHSLLPGGDHGIFIGQVETCHWNGREDPLLYVNGQYGRLA
ncbi:MAG: hypothetical protein CMH50_03620 [Myxococcales bacterium]|nr:hypothetical protein [Myxococcales bacterium]